MLSIVWQRKTGLDDGTNKLTRSSVNGGICGSMKTGPKENWS